MIIAYISPMEFGLYGCCDQNAVPTAKPLEFSPCAGKFPEAGEIRSAILVRNR